MYNFQNIRALTYAHKYKDVLLQRVFVRSHEQSFSESWSSPAEVAQSGALLTTPDLCFAAFYVVAGCLSLLWLYASWNLHFALLNPCLSVKQALLPWEINKQLVTVYQRLHHGSSLTGGLDVCEWLILSCWDCWHWENDTMSANSHKL